MTLIKAGATGGRRYWKASRPQRSSWKRCAARRAKPTRQKVLTALESLHKFDLGGLEVSYSASDHTGLDFADLSIVGSDGRFRR